jgi:hypothetical protein
MRMRRVASADLGAQQHGLIGHALADQREAGMRGGVPGTEYDAAAKLAIDGVGGEAGSAGELVTLDGGKSTPFWPAVYWCLRCGDLAAAVRLMQRAASQQVGVPSAWAALLALASSLAAAPTPSAAGAGEGASGAQLARQIADARAEYWASGAPPNAWLAVVYSVLCAPEAHAKLEELMPGRELSIEEWLWHR